MFAYDYIEIFESDDFDLPAGIYITVHGLGFVNLTADLHLSIGASRETVIPVSPTRTLCCTGSGITEESTFCFREKRRQVLDRSETTVAANERIRTTATTIPPAKGP